MEGFIALASFSLAYAFIVLLGLILLLNILGLPANWVVVLLVVLWKFLHPAAGALDVWFWIMFLGLAVLGEVLEMGVQVMNAKRAADIPNLSSILLPSKMASSSFTSTGNIAR